MNGYLHVPPPPRMEVPVRFPEGIRWIGATIGITENDMERAARGGAPAYARLVPDPVPGWHLYETMDGWLAARREA